VRALLAALALAAAVFGLAGGGTLLVERRLAALAPGGVQIAALHYNPISGVLRLADVRVRDAAGREMFRADSVEATASPLRLLGTSLALGRVRVVAPRLTLRTANGLDLDGLAAGLGAAETFLGTAGNVRVSVDDVQILGGVIAIEGAGEAGAPLLVRDLTMRLSRLTTASVDDRKMAFAVEMALYGTLVHVTGQPRAGGYAVHVRARGLDAPALLRDVPVGLPFAIERGQAEIDLDVLLTGGRRLATGVVKLLDAVVALPAPQRPRLSVAGLSIAVDGFDVTAGTGRITRLDLAAPSLALADASPWPALAALAQALREHPGIFLRRLAVSDGMLQLASGELRLDRIQLAAHVVEGRPDAPWSVSARAVVGRDADATVDGVVSRDLRTVDAVTRLQRIDVAPWRVLTGAEPSWDARLSFEGRVRLVVSEGESVGTASGQAELTDVALAEPGGFRADRIALGIRRLRWPQTAALLDSLVITRPTFAVASVDAWGAAIVAGDVSVVDGEIPADGLRRALHRVAVDLAAGPDGSARLKLSAVTDTGRVDIDRTLASSTSPTGSATTAGVPLGALTAALDDARRAPALDAPAALPAFNDLQ
jgi:hypothetical protein